MKSIVYLVTNTKNGSQYVGFTSQPFAKRKAQHKRASEYPQPLMVFSKAIKKHGWDAFSWEILEECSTIDAGIAAEIKHIAALNPRYNTTIGGKGMVGAPRTKKWRRNISTALKGRTVCQASLDKMVAMVRSGCNHKKIICLESGAVFNSVKEAAIAVNAKPHQLSQVLKRKEFTLRQQHYDYYEGPMTVDDRQVKLLEIELLRPAFKSTFAVMASLEA